MTRPLVALLSDFGQRDAYVGVMKAVVVSRCPDARLLDLCHEVPPQNLWSGAFLLASALAYLPRGTILLAVVDPGVGGERRAVAVETEDLVLVGPDNGLMSLALRHRPTLRAVVLDRAEAWLPEPSATFHGRDVFAPVAGSLAAGAALAELGSDIPPASLARLDLPEPAPTGDRLACHVLHVDGFGNLLTDLDRATFERWSNGAAAELRAWDTHVPIVEHYARAAEGAPLACFGSSGYLELAVARGNACESFGIGQGERLELERLG